MKCDSGNLWQNESQVWLNMSLLMVRDKGARLKSERNLSLTVGLKVLYNEYCQRKEWGSQWIIDKEYFDKKPCLGW